VARTEAAPRIEEVSVGRLIPAKWNYKKTGTPEIAQKLAASIRRDRSAGVLAVRVLGKSLEVMDGNHRLDAVKLLEWPTVMVENFGKITQAEAVLLAQRRNHQWFEDDTVALSALFKNVVLPKFDLETLEEFMPFNKTGLESLAKLCDFDWKSVDQNPDDHVADRLSFPMSDELRGAWEKWLAIAEQKIGEGTSKLDAFELALKTAIAVHERSQA
jgi:hypothetical protein